MAWLKRWMLGALTVGLGLAAGGPLPLQAQQAVGHIFRSTQSANLPTAETLNRGLLLFEVSHRFIPAISEGADALWGLDGAAYNRLGLAWAASDRVLLGIQRTNLDDNLELNARIGVARGGAESARWNAAIQGGAAVNFGARPTMGPDQLIEEDEAQFYAQAILNVGIAERLALGVVPTVVRNHRIEEVDASTGVVVGVNGQYFVGSAASLLVEWIGSGGPEPYDSNGLSFGVEFATRGHAFKLLATNQVRTNPTQYLGGAQFGYEPSEWRFGFNIVRLLSF